MSDGQWTIRDLDSRNGTFVGEEQIRGDRALRIGDIIRIANTQLAFVSDLSSAYSGAKPTGEIGTETVSNLAVPQLPPGLHETGESPEPTITHRRGNSRFLNIPSEEVQTGPKLGQAATRLCKLAFELAKQRDLKGVSEVALNGLLEGTRADSGAVLLLSKPDANTDVHENLRVFASKSTKRPTYQKVSRFLVETVFREGEAVLARNVEGDSRLSLRDSKGEIHTTSVICAPIRSGRKFIGLIHLYSTVEAIELDPVDLEFTLAVAENVAVALATLSRQQALVEDLSRSRHELDELRQRLGVESEIIGNSATMRDVHSQIARAAPSNATVLIRGESGVGKELVARAIHFSSPRNKGPFVCLNCAALTESLLESELFGHEKGAFTGATDRKTGKFEAADGGTLMLDEIGEMSPNIQAKFLRVLEGHPFERVGGSKPIKANVRVIAATNRDLEKAVTDGSFRKDLFFRLHVIEIYVPPLRKRQDDIIELAEHFLQKFNAETGRKIRAFTPLALQKMREYRWPGNVREIKNVIERAVVLSRSDFIEPDDLALTSLTTASEAIELPAFREKFVPMSLTEMEKRHIAATLKATNWNKSQTAQILEIERSTLDRKLKRYGIRRFASNDVIFDNTEDGDFGDED